MKKAIIVFGLLLLNYLLSVTSQAQVYKFQKFGVEKICHPFVYSVNQDKNGFIWACTGIGLCRYDGFNFVSNTKDSVPDTQSTVSFRDKSDNLWFGFNDGSIVRYDGIKFNLIKPINNANGTINDIAEDTYGNILIANQNAGIIIINDKKEKTVISDPFKGKLIYAINLTQGNELLVGTDNGIDIYSYNKDPKKIIFLSQLAGFPFSKVNTIVSDGNTGAFWVGTDDAGLLRVISRGNAKYKVENYGTYLHLENENIQSIFTDKIGNLWLSTNTKGLFKITISQGHKIKDLINYNSDNGLGCNLIKNAFQDREGNIWVATYGKGLALLLNESFVDYNYKKEIPDNNIKAVCFDSDGFWLGGTNCLMKVKTGLNRTIERYNGNNGIPQDEITSLFIDAEKSLWIGTSKNGAYRIAQNSQRAVNFFRSDNSLGNSVNTISGYNENIFIGTKNGIYQINIKNKHQLHFSTNEGVPPLPYNSIRQIYTDKKGNAWVATRSSSIFAINNDRKYNLKGGSELEFTAITEDKQGNIWAGTNGNGVFLFLQDTLNYFTTHEGLKSDYCYSLVSDQEGNIWIGHQLGLSRINTKTHQIKTFGSEYISGDVNFNAVSQSADGDIIYGTSDGLVLYEPKKNSTVSSAPLPNITSVIINDKEYSINDKITLPFSYYRMRVEFIGLQYSNPEQVTYQYKLDGFDPEWSEISKNRVAVYSRLPDGNYTFMLKTCNGDGVCNEIPLKFELKIRKPFWKAWWFFMFCIIGLVGSVYYIIKTRERKQIEFQEYLERLLEERTREVRVQKEEIELKNRDITDSINYAQRIQASILPSLRKLQHIFTGSFVYYAPRDIVSGDFYWFEVIPNTSKFLVVCADSTGHGVPGAFMSIIGTTLLKDIYTRSDIQKPSNILNKLDNELKLTLNQNVEGERPNDGMDIIVCEIDINTYYTRFASAMRPFIVYQNGEQLYFKGSRNSIGGQIREDKVFEDVELQLTKGDLIYMFSDGYPDQFGGPMGKKFKMVRLRNLLKDIHQKPMEEQYNYIRSNFELWKDELEQVDDVLFMGIKI